MRHAPFGRDVRLATCPVGQMSHLLLSRVDFLTQGALRRPGTVGSDLLVILRIELDCFLSVTPRTCFTTNLWWLSRAILFILSQALWFLGDPLSHIVPSSPANPALFMRSPQETNDQGRAHKSNTCRPRSDPAASGVQMIAHCGAHQLTNKHAHHIGSVDPIPRQWCHTVNGRSIGDLAGL